MFLIFSSNPCFNGYTTLTIKNSMHYTRRLAGVSILILMDSLFLLEKNGKLYIELESVSILVLMDSLFLQLGVDAFTVSNNEFQSLF